MTFGFKKRNSEVALTKSYGYKQILECSPKLDEEDESICEWSQGFELVLSEKKYVLFCETAEELGKWTEGFRLFFEKKNLMCSKKVPDNDNDNSLDIISIEREFKLDDIKEKQEIIQDISVIHEREKDVPIEKVTNYIVQSAEKVKVQVQYNKLEIRQEDRFNISRQGPFREFVIQYFLKQKEKTIGCIKNLAQKMNMNDDEDEWDVLPSLDQVKEMKKMLQKKVKPSVDSLRREIKFLNVNKVANDSAARKIISDKNPYKIKVVDINDKTIIENLDIDLYHDEPIRENIIASKGDLDALLEKGILQDKNCPSKKIDDLISKILEDDVPKKGFTMELNEDVSNKMDNNFTKFPEGSRYYNLRHTKYKDNLHMAGDPDYERERLLETIRKNRPEELNISDISNTHVSVGSPHFGNISIIAQRYNKVDNIDEWKDHLEKAKISTKIELK